MVLPTSVILMIQSLQIPSAFTRSSRDGLSREQVARRLAAQWTDSRRETLADMTIYTDDSTPVLPKIIELIDNLKKKNNGN